MRIATVDIGTNTVLLLIADIDERGSLTLVEHQQRVPRLGAHVDRNRAIGPQAFDRIAWILNEYRDLSRQQGADRIVACATSAVRDANNRPDFLAYLRNVTGLDVEVLSGDEEALWTYRGAVSGLPPRAARVAVLDVGGGSTELSFAGEISAGGHRDIHRSSLEIGSVRITERFFRSSPPQPEEVARARAFILEALSRLPLSRLESFGLVAVAGTATTLACLDQGLAEFSLEKVAGYEMSARKAGEWCNRLLAMTPTEIGSLSGATEGRADILAAGALILHECMTYCGFGSLSVSERGLRYGLAIREWERRLSGGFRREP